MKVKLDDWNEFNLNFFLREKFNLNLEGAIYILISQKIIFIVL